MSFIPHTFAFFCDQKYSKHQKNLCNVWQETNFISFQKKVQNSHSFQTYERLFCTLCFCNQPTSVWKKIFLKPLLFYKKTVLGRKISLSEQTKNGCKISIFSLHFSKRKKKLPQVPNSVANFFFASDSIFSLFVSLSHHQNSKSWLNCQDVCTWKPKPDPVMLQNGNKHSCLYIIYAASSVHRLKNSPKTQRAYFCVSQSLPMQVLTTIMFQWAIVCSDDTFFFNFLFEDS